MGKKYILEPDGRIRDSETGSVGKIVENPNPESTDINYLTPIKNSANVDNPNVTQLSSDLRIFTMESNASSNLDLVGTNDESNFRTSMSTDEKYNKSFDFLRNESELKDLGEDANKSFYTPFNYILDSKPQDFATEFEILTGTRLIDSPGEDGNFLDTLALMFDYFSTIFIQILVIEGIVLVNNIGGFVEGGKRPIEQYSLVLGKYTVNNFDIFTRYITDVLNYPWKKSNVDERLISFFIGFNEWIAPESVINLSQLLKSSTDGYFLNLYDGSGGLAGIGSSTRQQQFLFLNMTLLTPFIAILIEQTLEATLNYTHVKNRFKLLTRKFKQESYWKDNILNKAKLTPEDGGEMVSAGFFTQLNYYFIKFAIERIQVGLKILNKYVLDASYMQERQRPTGSNRVSANRSSINIKGNAKFKKNKKNEKNVWLSGRADDSLYNKRRIKPQTTNLRALPQLFQAHNEFFNSLALSGGGTAYTTESIAQNFYDNHKDTNSGKTGYRIPTETVGLIEAFLEAEYMPFYFHDIRTNEVISFHAFIESISDSFNPEYNTSSGFGRIDDVRSYVKTTRNINLSFTIAATSPEDHDLMWYQINKLVSMVYPQWSDAYDANVVGDDISFKYPFTQVPTASPLIRLRVGDVIKSNYSQTALARLHGVGHRKIDEAYNQANQESFTDSSINEKGKSGKNLDRFEYYLQPGQYETIEPTGIGSTLGISLGGATRPKVINLTEETRIINTPGFGTKYTSVKIPYVENDSDEGKTEEFLLRVDVSKIYVASHHSGFLSENDQQKYAKNHASHIINQDNPIVKSYESGMSKGLAGFITQLDVNYNEVNWETGRMGSKAPMFVKVTLNYAPVHDIPPGLDHTGMMRAPVYNVGRLLNSMYHNSVNEPDKPQNKTPASQQAQALNQSPPSPPKSAPASPTSTPDTTAKANALKANEIVPSIQIDQSPQKSNLIGDITLEKIESGEIPTGEGKLRQMKRSDFSSMQNHEKYNFEYFFDG